GYRAARTADDSRGVGPVQRRNRPITRRWCQLLRRGDFYPGTVDRVGSAGSDGGDLGDSADQNQLAPGASVLHGSVRDGRPWLSAWNPGRAGVAWTAGAGGLRQSADDPVIAVPATPIPAFPP